VLEETYSRRDTDPDDEELAADQQVSAWLAAREDDTEFALRLRHDWAWGSRRAEADGAAVVWVFERLFRSGGRPPAKSVSAAATYAERER
jgi:hypothetical protein